MADDKSHAEKLKEEIDNIRQDFFNVYKKNIEDGEFHEDDLKRLKENDGWIRAYRLVGGKKHEGTLNAIKDALKWRKEFGVNDFLKTEQLPFPEEYLTKDALFVKGADKNGTPILHLIIRMHKKGEYPHDQLCRFIVYQLEKHYKFNYDHQLVLFFNMIGTGFSNMDMELIRFLTNCMLYYYPRIAGYTLVLQMPFIFQAAWKIIKLWLSNGIANLVKFVDKNSLKEFIDDEELLKNIK